MTNTKIDILDQVNIDSTASPLASGGDVQQTLLANNKSTNVGNFDFLKKYLTKKNIYILCGVILAIGLVYYFFFMKKKEKKSEKNTDINIELPTQTTNQDFFIPLPDNTPSQMNTNEYNALLNQQMQQANLQPQVNLQQANLPDINLQQTMELQQSEGSLPQVVHPGQNLQEIREEETDEVETPALDNQNLTADEIKQISEQLQRLQATNSQ